MRWDVFLVQCGLISSRTRAQDLINAGKVFYQNKKVAKPSEKIEFSENQFEKDRLQIVQDKTQKFVSRSGAKLEGAFQKINSLQSSPLKNLNGYEVLDIGQSTGGFTDCCLHFGAKKIVGVDVGHGQLDDKLKADERVVVLEKINARDLGLEILSEKLGKPQTKFNLVVMDVSFISITLILPRLAEMLESGAHLVSLVKPQFELSPDRLNDKGIVKNHQDFEKVEAKVRESVAQSGLKVLEYFESSLEGKDGNKEFFVYAIHSK
jgi:23S rRNA (cytidine1920-2'-O)/16S rRNA (cytidine1409-2'-O)-methyltransferase